MQLSYVQTMDPAFAGMKSDCSLSRIDGYAAESVILPGCGVVTGTKADKQVKSPTAAGDKFKGIALIQAKEMASDGSVQYKAKDTVPVINLGRVWANVKGAVAIDGDVFLIYTGADAGKFAAAAGANAFKVDGAKFKTATAGDGIAVIELN